MRDDTKTNKVRPEDLSSSDVNILENSSKKLVFQTDHIELQKKFYS